MTVISSPGAVASRKAKTKSGGSIKAGSEAMAARMFLAIACFWPLFIMALFAASAPQYKDIRSHPRELLDKKNEINEDIRFKFRTILDRVDIMGYGPTHPRVAVVIVGDDSKKIISSVESLFRHTPLERIFQVCVVVDGRGSDAELSEELEKIDSGAVPHWHGLRADIHMPGDSNADDKAAHGSRIQVLFNEEKRGISESRADAANFLHMLSEKHEKTGLKSPQEDLILLLLQSGAQFIEGDWLAPMTGALIVPPPLVTHADPKLAEIGVMKLANAVVFNTEGMGKRTSFDLTFTPTVSDASASDINHSSGNSYPTPAWNGAAIAMRLDTYRNLPAQDNDLTEEWPANLELSLNLWLCADGMDMIKGLQIKPGEPLGSNSLLPEMMARFAAAWMDDVTVERVFHEYSKKFDTLTHLEFDTLMSKARDSQDFPIDLTERCRSFSWYSHHINTDITDAMVTAGQEIKEEEEKQRREEEMRKINAKMDAQVAAAKAKKESEIALKAAKAAEEQAKAKLEAAKKDTEKALDEEEAEEALAKAEKAAENFIPDMAHGDAVAEERSAAGNDERRKPSVPLRPFNLENVQKPKPVDISFVDVSGGHKEHPHMGAKDANGNFGYIHDETALRNNPPPMNFAGSRLTEACSSRDNNYRMMHEKVRVDLEGHNAAEASGRKRDKIFCLVYTIESGHPKIPAIRETWGPKCDGFMVGSTKTDPALGTVEIPHEGEEEYNNIWQKVRSMWSYIYDNYYEKYDWFHIGGDDLFLIVENLRLYLESEEIKAASNGGIYLPNGDEKTQTPLFLGRRFAYQGDLNDIFISGGSGYTMNKASLKLLVTEAFPNYFPHAHTFSEDTMVAKLLRKFEVYPYDTKDEFGGERYMPFMPGHHYGYKLPKDPMKSNDWYAKYSIDIKEGVDHCSAQSVAFHYVKGDMMYRLFVLAYNMCPADPA